MLGPANLKKREEEEKAARQVASGGVTPAMSNAIRQIAMDEAAAELAQAKAGGAVGVFLPRASDNVRSGLGPGRGAYLPGSVGSEAASMNGGDGYLARWDDGLSSAREQAEIAAWEAEQARRRAAALAAAREEQARAAAEQVNTQNASTKKEIPLLSDAEREARAKAAREAEAAYMSPGYSPVGSARENAESVAIDAAKKAQRVSEAKTAEAEYMNSKLVYDQLLQERKAAEARNAERAQAAKAAEAAYMESKWVQDEEKTKYRGPVKEGTSMLKAPARIESVLDRNKEFALPIVNKPVIQKGIRESMPRVNEFWPTIGRAIDSGIASAGNSVVNTVETIDSLIDPNQSSLQPLYDYYENIQKEKQAAVQADIDRGAINPIVAQFVQTLPNIAAQTTLAAMSGGTSAGATMLGNPSTSQQILNQVAQMASSPQFWNSVVNSFGNSFQEAKAAGANDIQALSTAIQYSLPSAMIESSGGIETLTQNILNGKSPLSAVVKSGVEEGLEEVVQYPFSEASKVSGYGKEPVIYSTEEDALINPVQMAQNFGLGALGGALGGGLNIAANGFLPRPGLMQDVQPSAVQQEVQADVSQDPSLPVNTEAPAVPSESRVDGLLQKMKESGTVSNRDMEFLIPGNNVDTAARAEFTEKTGVELPSTASGTKQAVREYMEKMQAPDVLEKTPEAQAAVEEPQTAGSQILPGVQGAEVAGADNRPEKTKVTVKPRYLPRASDLSTGGNETVAKKATFRRLPKASDLSAPVSIPGRSSNNNVPPNVENEQRGYVPEYQQLIDKYGAFEHGEIPKNGTQNMNRLVPKKSGENQVVGQFIRNASESGTTSNELFDEIQKGLVNNEFSHEIESDKEALSYANRLANNGELQEAWKAAKNKTGRLSKKDIAAGERLLVEYSNSGDIQKAEEVLSDLCAAATAAGQELQAFRLLKKMTPTGKAMFIQKTVERINRDILEGGKYRNSKVEVEENGKIVQKKVKELSDGQKVVSLNQKTLDAVLKAKDSKELDNAVDKAFNEIKGQLPVKFSERFDAWRYLAMLGNVKTHGRNVASNAAFIVPTNVKDLIASGLEKALLRGDKKSQRTKSIVGFSESDKALKALAAKSFQETVDKASKYEDANDLWRNRKLLAKPVQKVADANSWLLEKEDEMFKRLRYKTAFASFAKARGYTADFLTGKTRAAKQALGDCEAYALQQAKEAVFQQDSEIANMLSKLSKKNGIYHFFIEGLLPFKKTPINITSTAFNYSPFGLAKGVYDLANGKNSAVAIDLMAKGVTGSAFAGLGYLLASMGVLTAGESEDQKEKNAEAMSGRQSYALQIGDYSVTLDFLSPAAIPLFLGAEAFDIITTQDGEVIAEVMESLGNLAAPIFEMSMLEGLNDTLSSISDPADIIPSAMAFGMNYLAQSIPTVVGQTARTIDPVRRSTQADAANTVVPKSVQKVINKTIAKIPGLSTILQPYVDPMGNQDVAENLAWNAVEQFISPGYVSKLGESDVMKEIRRVSGAMGEKGVMPGYVDSYLTVDKKKVLLSAAQVTERQTVTGTTYAQIVKELMETDSYKNRDDAGKYDLIEDAYTYAKAMGNMAVSDYEPDKWILNANKAADAGIPISLFLDARDLFNSDSEKFKTTEQQRSWIKSQKLTAEQKSLLDSLLISDLMIIPIEKEVDYSSDSSYKITTQHPDTANKIRGIIGGKITDQVAWKTYEATSRYTGEGASEMKRQYIMNLSGLSGAEKKKLAQVFVDKDDSRDYSSIAMFNISGMHKNYQEKYNSIKGEVTAEQFWAAYKACDAATWPKNTSGAKEAALRAAIRTKVKGLTAYQADLLYQQFKNMQQ